MTKTKKIAIIADWLTNQGGAEKVVLDLHKAFPNATIYTSIYDPIKLPQFKSAKIITSFLQKFPLSKKYHQMYLALMPYAFESFDLSEFDIVISSCFACSKGVITKPETIHISYCHNPMRYVWDESHKYVKEHTFNPILKFLAQPFLHKIRIWDRLAAERVDHYIANSEYVKKRIKKYYQRDSKVINPGFDLPKQLEVLPQKDDYYLIVGRLKSYKKIDIAIKAFNKSKKRLLIVGEGEDKQRLISINTNENTKFLGFVGEGELEKLYQKAKGFIFPQNEDFGITPLEAQHFGCPVIAYKKGGALETVTEYQSGLFFEEQTPEGLNLALNKFEKTTWDYNMISTNIQKFSSERFIQEIQEYLNNI